MLGRSALLAATNVVDYGNWLGNYSDVSLLLRNGTLGSLVPFDESPTPKAITAVGDAGISTMVFKYGDSSFVFDGSGDWVEGGVYADFSFGNDPFTIEAWIYLNTASVQQGIFSLQNNGSASTISGYVLEVSTGQLHFRDYSNGFISFSISSSEGVITAGTWIHVAVSKWGTGTNEIGIFVNGNLVASGTRNANIPVTSFTAPGRVGAWRYSVSTRPLNGYIDDLRITKGIARYTSNFTPPPAELPANITDDPDYNSVSLLLRNGTPQLVPFDESPTEKEITAVGNASVTTAVARWNEGTGGSSLAFDGSGDYFSTTKNADFEFGSGNFTVECWARLNVTNVDQGFVAYTAGITASVTGWSIEHLTTGFRFYFYTGLTPVARTHPVVASANVWYHVAAVRNGSSLILYVNGVPSATTTTAASINAPTGALLTVGSVWTTLRFLNGYIDDLRITKGIARYTSNFTPPPAELPNF